jgi:hypothetical protein
MAENKNEEKGMKRKGREEKEKTKQGNIEKTGLAHNFNFISVH